MDYKELSYKITEKQINEGTTSWDQSLPILKISDVMYRLYTVPLVSELGSCLPVTKPSGVTFGLARDYDPVPGVPGKVDKTYASTAETVKLNEIKFNLMSKRIYFKTKKLASRWTLEAVQDYIKMHTDTKSDDEISQILSRELTNEMILELDAEAIDYMYTAAKKTNWKFQDSQRSLQVWELLEKITECGMDMLQMSCYRSRINVFCSKKIAAKLSTHPLFERPSRDMNKTKSIYLVGSIGNVDIFADIFEFLSDKGSDYIMVALKDPDPDGLASSIMYFPYANSIYTSPAQDGSSDVIFYNIFRYGLSLNPTTSDAANTNEMLRFVNIEYGEGDPTPVMNHDMFIGYIPTTISWLENYDNIGAENYDFQTDIENNLVDLETYVFEDVTQKGYFTYELKEPGSFIFFIFEDGKENVWMNTSKNYNTLTTYLTNPKTYTITKDLGSGLKTYKVVVNNQEVNSIPGKIYMRKAGFGN